MSVLIIDSTTGSDLNTMAIFEDYGFHQVRFVRSANEMRTLLAKENELASVRLVIINSELADADGFELCREIRATDWGKTQYILVLISSMGNKVAIDKTKHSGANDFAVKPFDGEQFKQHLTKYTVKHTVLLIEDDPLARQMVNKVLDPYSLEVIVKDDGLKAYNLINSMMPPALVLLDIGLPNMNGISLLKHIRSRQGWKKLPVIMFTGSTDANDVKASLTMGASDYIVKPFKVDDFTKRIVKYFQPKT